MALIAAKLCQNAFRMIPNISFFDVKTKIGEIIGPTNQHENKHSFWRSYKYLTGNYQQILNLDRWPWFLLNFMYPYWSQRGSIASPFVSVGIYWFSIDSYWISWMWVSEEISLLPHWFLFDFIDFLEISLLPHWTSWPILDLWEVSLLPHGLLTDFNVFLLISIDFHWSSLISERLHCCPIGCC